MTDLSIDHSDIEAPDGPLLIVASGVDEDGRGAVPHQHSRGQLLGSMRGLLSVGVEDGVWIVPTIQAVWLPPRRVHWARAHGPFVGWGAYVAENACRDLPQRPCMIRTSSLLREAIMRAAEWPLGPLDNARMRIAAVILDEIRSLPVESFGLQFPATPGLKRIAHALVNDPADPRGLDDWAQWAGLSSRTLSRRFVTETGFNFTAWRQRARLMRSLEMLAADVPVTTIALDLGYSTASAFIAVFRQAFGETPSAYRRHL